MELHQVTLGIGLRLKLVVCLQGHWLTLMQYQALLVLRTMLGTRRALLNLSCQQGLTGWCAFLMTNQIALLLIGEFIIIQVGAYMLVVYGDNLLMRVGIIIVALI